MMNKFAIQDLVRKNISKLLPYSCARDEYKGDQAVFLDANENTMKMVITVIRILIREN